MGSKRTVSLNTDHSVVIVQRNIGLDRDKDAFGRSLVQSNIKVGRVALVLNKSNNSTLGSDSGRKGNNPIRANRKVVMNKLSKERG
jgi:hypothetical protein